MDTPRYQYAPGTSRSQSGAKSASLNQTQAITTFSLSWPKFSKQSASASARAHIELERFLANASGILDPNTALDLGVLQRIIPKIRGFKRDLVDGLEDLQEALENRSCDRSARIVSSWLGDSVSDDEFLDGTDTRIGLLS